MDAKTLVSEQKERILKSAARQMAELDRRVEIADLIDDLEFPGVLDFIYGQGYRCDGSLSIKANTGDIPAIMAAFPPIPAGKFKGSCTSFHCLTRTEKKDPVPMEIAPFVVNLDKTKSYPLNTFVQWWANVGPFVLQIKVAIIDATWAKMEENIVRDHKGRTVKRYWWAHIEKSQDQYVKWWASPGDPNNYTFYWTDPDLRWEDL